MNEQMKTELSQDLNKILMEMYNKGFKDCEAAAMQAIEAGIRQAIFSEREACAKLVESYHPDSFFMGQVQDAANLIRTRGDK
jgi:hypothetical protein